MGYELRRKLREALGREIAGLQRAVALEIADDANDGTRLSYATLEQLAMWTAAKDVNVVRNALKRLAAAGLEFRVPLGVGKDGRALYAVPGKRLTFRVPEVEGIATATPSEERAGATPAQGVATTPTDGATATPSRYQEGATAPSDGAVAPAEGAAAHSDGAGATPFPSSPSVSSPSVRRVESSAAGHEAAGRTDRAAQDVHQHAGATQQPGAEAIAAEAAELARRFDFGRDLDNGAKQQIFDHLVRKLAEGWRPEELFRALDGRWDGAVDRVGVWISRVRRLPALPERPPVRPTSDPAAKRVPPRPPRGEIVSSTDKTAGAVEFQAARRQLPRKSDPAPISETILNLGISGQHVADGVHGHDDGKVDV